VKYYELLITCIEIINYGIFFSEKREKYDNGEDPLDPETQGNQGFNPFQHHFHGSPFQFKFHFN
jgi:hypothetical protein